MRRGHRRDTLLGVHRKQFVTAQILTFPLERLNQRQPRVRGDTATLLPFLDLRALLPEVRGHFGERVPAVKDVFDSFHKRDYASDELSGQCPPMIPVTVVRTLRTISHMGRASTPTKFRAEMAKRLTSARIVAGYATKKAAADKLGITLDRYEKWELGRTPVPAQYVGPVCHLFNVDANYLFNTEARTQARDTG